MGGEMMNDTLQEQSIRRNNQICEEAINDGRFKKGHKPIAGFKKGNSWGKKPRGKNYPSRFSLRVKFCIICQKRFLNPYKATKTCSRKCQYIHHSNTMTGKLTKEKNHNWKGGISPYPNHYRMMKQRLIILMEKPKCERCGKKATEIHHKDENKSNHGLSNLMAICHPCHMRFNSKYYRRYGLTLEEITKKLSFTKKKRWFWYKHPEEINKYIQSEKSGQQRLGI